ncbi:MAG: hypothetical protein PSV35_06925 [bacterium]|nr:hypothetical protein [bacterium]
MPTFADFFKEFIKTEPYSRIKQLTPELWPMLADIKDKSQLSLALMGLVNNCSDLVVPVLNNQDLLNVLDRPWHWDTLFSALRSMNYPAESCNQLILFLQNKGDEGQYILTKLNQKLMNTSLVSQ